MKKTELNKKEIEALLPHREPMLLIDKLTKIVHLKSATAIMYVKKNGSYVQGHFPGQPVMPGVLIVEAFGQAAAALTAHGIDKETYDIFDECLKLEGYKFKFYKKPKDSYFHFKEKLKGKRFDVIAASLQKWTEQKIIQWVKNTIKIKKINNEKQTKFYLKHKNEKGEIILQYYPDNYKTKKRLDKLESEGNEIITHSIVKKKEKVLKKEKIVDNIKINTIFD